MEYLLLFFEYFILKGLKHFFFKLIVLLAIVYCIYHLINDCIFEKNVKDFYNNNITILGILIGFTVSVFTIFMTIDNKNIRDAKLKKIGRIIFTKEITLYDSLVMNLAFLIVIQGFSLIANFIYPLLIPLETDIGKIAFSINITFTINIIMILMRSILDFYFILSKKEN
jgi:hypothetical protein